MQIKARISGEDKTRILAAAHRRGLSLSELIRTVALKAVGAL